MLSNSISVTPGIPPAAATDRLKVLTGSVTPVKKPARFTARRDTTPSAIFPTASKVRSSGR